MLMCYICGREFGSKSLDIHVKACKVKWEKEQMLKPRNERRPCPEAPKNFDTALSGAKTGGYNVDSYNDAAYDSFKNKALEGCPNCGRTFNPDSLIKHMKMCKTPKDGVKRSGSPGGVEESKISSGTTSGGAGASSPSRGAGGIQKPRTLMCYICGREFGSSSLEIHLKSCKVKFEND